MTNDERAGSDVPSNRFSDCESVDQVIRRAVGAGSTCWHGGTGQAEFDTAQAIRVSDEAFERVAQILDGQRLVR